MKKILSSKNFENDDKYNDIFCILNGIDYYLKRYKKKRRRFILITWERGGKQNDELRFSPLLF
jgi:hypothetical protein